MQTKLIEGADQIGKAIASIAGRGAKLDTDIQRAGLSVLSHVAKHNDTTLADKLVHAMPKGARKLALVEWLLAFGTFGKLDAKVDKDAVAAGRLFKHDKTRRVDLAGAEAKPWHEFRKEPPVMTAFDAGAAVRSVLSRMTNAQAAGLTVQNREAAIREAEALLLALRGDGVESAQALL